MTYFEEAAVERRGHGGAVDNQVLARVVHVADELQHSDATGGGHRHAVVLGPRQRLQAAHRILQPHGRLPPSHQEAERGAGPGGRVRHRPLPARLALFFLGRRRPVGRGPHPGLVGRIHLPSEAEAGPRARQLRVAVRLPPLAPRPPAPSALRGGFLPLRPGAPPSQEGPRRC